MPSLTVENYLKTILQQSQVMGGDLVTTGQLATALRVSPGTVTAMLKTLSEGGLVKYRPYEGVTLSSTGRKLALRMVRRHRLLESFLVRTLSLTWDEVHEEAENLEHAVSDVLVDRIDDFLGHPTVDPHGDPIPAADGLMRCHPQDGAPVTGWTTGCKVRVVRVIDQSSDFLRYLAEQGCTLDTVAEVTQNSREAGIVTLKIGPKIFSLGYPAAHQILAVAAAPAGGPPALRGDSADQPQIARLTSSKR
jgi:DtxR family Mn-dependent transcriptional regulator